MKRLGIILATLLAVLLCPSADPALADYPYYQAYPTAMNLDDGNVYNFKTDGYYSDGTWITNPVISAGDPVNVSKNYSSFGSYLFKTLTGSSSINITNKNIAPVGTYTVYSAVPTNSTVASAWGDTSGYYPDPTASGSFSGLWYDLALTWPSVVEAYASAAGNEALKNYYGNNGLDWNSDMAQYQQIPTSLNQGNAISVTGKATTSAAGGGSVKVLSSSSTNGAYYLPYASDPTEKAHGVLSDNVVWSSDFRMDSDSSFPNGPDYHLLPYGWALDPKNCNDALTVQTLAMDGGSVVSAAQNATYNGAETLAISSQPFNYWLKLINQETTQYKDPSTGDFTTGAYSTLVQNYIAKLLDTAKGGPGYPFPSPTWLSSGTYMPLQPQAGFQGNLLRWYTAWGAWNLIDNTSGLFVRANGDVEIPVDSNGDPVPWVTQSWQDQNYTFINNTSQPVAATTDTYPGGEIYLAGNTYFPETAGVMNAYREYMVWDNVSDSNGQLSNRVPDNWLGLAGQNMDEIIQWDDAGGTEPGGQGNKPYMFSVNVDTDGNAAFMFESANSAPVAKVSQADVSDGLYSAAIWVDADDGNGYQKLATFGYTWQGNTLETSTSGTPRPQWTANSAGLGAMVPSLSLNQTASDLSSLGLSVVPFKATSWAPGDRGEIGFSPETGSYGSDNQVPGNDGTDYYQYQVSMNLTPSQKVIVVLED